jgi:alpha/beta superfamily hydrolase
MTEHASIAVPAAGSSAPLSLEAVFDAGTRDGAVRGGGAVIAPPHPLYGGRLDNPVVIALADGLRAAGLATLCFNFRGIGGSSGHASGAAADADADYRAAVDHLMRKQHGPYVAAGYSFGAAAAIRVAAKDHRIERIVVVAPPVAMLDFASLRVFHGAVTFIVGDDDMYAPLDEVQHLLAPLPHVQLKVIAGVDHFFASGGGDQIELLARDSLR